MQRNDYYTGIVFTGYVNGIGDAVLSGGRYDSLLEEFDMPMGAAGFAIDTDAVTLKSLADGAVSYADNPEVLVYARDGCEMEAIAYVARLNSQGKKAQFSVFETLEETRRFADRRGIETVVIVGE